ncbi:MAG: DEAD/DEAH box helicase [Deltaproteobacteria bacterium]|nr:DEAD/DEAH box helicase [Deltaproteobacteria bacterium]
MPPLVPLPIDEALPAVVAALRAHPAVVVKAPPGAGKTTRVPPALLAAGLAGTRRIVVLEPRRLAARAAARRIAQEQGFSVGEQVGFQVRLERAAGPRTRILVVTEGILGRMLADDPFIEDVALVVFDEFHERSVHTDLALALCRAAQGAGRADLKLCVLSATLQTGPVAAYLGGCPVVESAGRPFPVTVEHLPERDARPPAEVAAAGVRRVLPRTSGDVLVFLPGVGEIRRTAALLESHAAAHGLAVTPLYGDLSSAEQDAALCPGPRRKIVLATNGAESSVTVAGVTAVVDSGLARVLRYDPALGLDRLELGRISRASATQRTGRAGREGPGLALRLWTAPEEATLRDEEEPEIRRVDLAAPALTLRAWGASDLERFDWFERPDGEALGRALELLERLGALEHGALTPLGRTMARLPAHPRVARLLCAGHRLGHLEDAALAGALLQERDPLRRRAVPPGSGPRSRSDSDVIDRLYALRGGAGTDGGRRGARGHDRGDAAHGDDDAAALDAGRARFIRRAGDQLAALTRRELRDPPPPTAPADEAVMRALLHAYPDRVARRREPGSRRAVMVGGRGVTLADDSAVLDPELFLCVEVDAGRRGERAEGLVRQASLVRREWLPAALLETAVETDFDPDAERVVARRRTRYLDLPVAEQAGEPDPGRAAELLAAAVARDPGRALPLGDEEVVRLRARLTCLAAWRPALHLPAVDDAALQGLLPTVCAGRRSFAELRRTPLVDVLLGRLDARQRQALEREAPDRLAVPSGSRLRLEYRPGEPPVLRARIQELFGLLDTPRVAGGQVPVLIHLLAPNSRPQQVTSDLRSFWQKTYPEVRKELRARYPKHAWPEDPWTATPTRGARRRR